MPDDPTPCPACGSPRHIAWSGGEMSRLEAVRPYPHTFAACSVCGGLDREKTTRLRLRLGDAPWPEDAEWLLDRLDTDRAARQAAEADREQNRSLAKRLGANWKREVEARRAAEANCGRLRAALAGEGGEEDA